MIGRLFMINSEIKLMCFEYPANWEMEDERTSAFSADSTAEKKVGNDPNIHLMRYHSWIDSIHLSYLVHVIESRTLQFFFNFVSRGREITQMSSESIGIR